MQSAYLARFSRDNWGPNLVNSEEAEMGVSRWLSRTLCPIQTIDRSHFESSSCQPVRKRTERCDWGKLHSEEA
jgi:hypothetical protein